MSKAPAMKRDYTLKVSCAADGKIVKKFDIEVNSKWPLKALIYVVEETFLEKTEQKQDFSTYGLLAPETPDEKLDYTKPISTYFKNNDKLFCYGEVAKVQPKIPHDKKLPVTVITGFLGAGKTTLMNYILHEQKDHKFFIIQNEFGAVSIDDELVQDQMSSSTKENIITLDNGCVCCTVRGDLTKAFVDILDGVKSGKYDIEGVLVETTGMANPGPVVGTFLQVPNIQSEMRLDSIVTVVAADHIIDHLEGGSGKNTKSSMFCEDVDCTKDDKMPEDLKKELEKAKEAKEADGDKKEEPISEAVEQVIAADRIILNKLDLVKPREISNIKNVLRSLNKCAKIIPATKSKVDLKKILNVQAFNLQRMAEMEDILFDDEDKPHGDEHGDHSDDDHSHGSHSHSHGDGDKHGHSHGDGDEHSHSHGDGDKHSHSHGDGDKHSHSHGDGDKHSHSHGDGDEHSHSHGDGDKHGHSHGDGKYHTHSHKKIREHKHSSGVTSIGLKVYGVIDMEKFSKFFQKVSLMGMYRTKGIMHVKNEKRKFVFHGVKDNMDCSFSNAEWKDQTKKENKLVFIGRNLVKADLEKELRACLVVDEEDVEMETKK